MAGGYENINIIDSNNVIVAAEKGFFHIDYARYVKTNEPVRVLIRNVVSSDGSNDLLFGGYTTGPTIPVPDPVKYQGNSLHFEFSAAYYAQQLNIDYSYYLKGFDKGWSPWSKRPDKDYTNLPAGDYTFQVRARNTPGNTSAVSSYSFSILPPWYRTWWAYALYTLLFFGLLYLFYKRQQQKYARLQLIKLKEQQRQYNEEQQRLRFLHQIEVEKNEKEIIHLTNAKLQGEIEHKNRELASNAMIFVQKGELLSKIKDELTRLKNNAELEKDSKDFKKIIRIIDSELDNPQDWEQFAVHFDSVHTNYLKNLKDRFPELTASELKLCAYLRMNLTTKEISQLMNISIRGVETSRYRLRKKLQLSNDANLVHFLLTVTA
jgi:DNA-binding CsgD family transcriptional regulator